MLLLNLPKFDIKITQKFNKTVVFDVLRQKYIALTPEEWVRQHFVNFLIHHKNYPKALMANEVMIKLNNTIKRCDTVLYNRDLTPKMIIEYKAPHIKITQETFNQIYRYNIVLRVKYLVVSNGMNHFCCMMDYENQTCSFLKDIPDFKEL